jgi:hypothetical protein
MSQLPKGGFVVQDGSMLVPRTGFQAVVQQQHQERLAQQQLTSAVHCMRLPPSDLPLTRLPPSASSGTKMYEKPKPDPPLSP